MIVPTDSRPSRVRTRGWGGEGVGDWGVGPPVQRASKQVGGKSEKNQRQQLQQLLERERAARRDYWGNREPRRRIVKCSFGSSGASNYLAQ